jgi:hypothetical protein
MDSLVELCYVFFSFLLMIYGAWVYSRRRERSQLYLILSFASLTLSMTLLFLDYFVWFPATRTVIRLIEIAGLALYASFVISLIMALKKLAKT